MKVIITGGTGLVGKKLQNKLLNLGVEVIVLSRQPKSSNVKGLSYALWNVDKQEIDANIVCSADHIIHLAGANIAEKRWTDTQKQLIIDSRVKTANLIFKTLKENSHTVQSFISASGISFYGTVTTNKIYKETDAIGTDFLAKVCEQWEKAAWQFNTLGIRTVCLRTGVVFAKENSALQKMALPVKMGVGAPLGTGKQIMPIIYIDDLIQMYTDAIFNTNWIGAYNAVAVNHTNSTVTQAIAKSLNKTLWLPNVPAFVLKVILGQMANLLLPR